MKVTYFYKITDIILILLLILSSGGLLFVFNRNICYAIFLGALLLAVLFSKDKLKTREVYSALLTSFVSLRFILVFLLNHFILPGLELTSLLLDADKIFGLYLEMN